MLFRSMVSVATAMIPFLENDDANRALMGANMQRQAVPLLVTEAPIVATGQEYKNCQDAEVCVLAEEDGVVTKVSADAISVQYDSGRSKTYKLIKFLRSNHGTCINQRPIVDVGQRFKKKGYNSTIKCSLMFSGMSALSGMCNILPTLEASSHSNQAYLL